MNFFRPKWIRLHHRVCDLYEREAFAVAIEKDRDYANPTIIAAKLIAQELKIAPAEAARVALTLYAEFQDFKIGEIIEKALIAKGQQPKKSDLDDLLRVMKNKFHEEKYWHCHYIYFVISYLLEKREYGIMRGDYLIRITLDTVPDETGVMKLIKRTLRFARLQFHEEKRGLKR